MSLPDPPPKPSLTSLSPLQPLMALPEPAHLLFTYGTLMLTTGIPEVDAVLRDAGNILGRGWIHGRLFDLGEYPGAVRPEAGAESADPVSMGAGPQSGALEEDAPKVWGRLLHLKDAAGFYSVIDRYEGFDAADPAGSEFVRARTLAFLPGRDQGIPCQVYWYNLSGRDKPEIRAGDYLAYWHSRGKPAQRRIVS